MVRAGTAIHLFFHFICSHKINNFETPKLLGHNFLGISLKFSDTFHNFKSFRTYSLLWIKWKSCYYEKNINSSYQKREMLLVYCLKWVYNKCSWLLFVSNRAQNCKTFLQVLSLIMDKTFETSFRFQAK